MKIINLNTKTTYIESIVIGETFIYAQTLYMRIATRIIELPESDYIGAVNLRTGRVHTFHPLQGVIPVDAGIVINYNNEVK